MVQLNVFHVAVLVDILVKIVMVMAYVQSVMKVGLNVETVVEVVLSPAQTVVVLDFLLMNVAINVMVAENTVME